jgi:radical SAM enzyme (TIGR01210 family)
MSLAVYPDLPAACEVVPAWVRGEPARRAMIILRAAGCAWDRNARGGCTHCGFRLLTTQGQAVSPAGLVRQADAALSRLDCAGQRILEIDVYNSGNFLNEGEIPAEAQIAIAARVAREAAVRVLLVESRPEYITGVALERLDAAIERRSLELEVGLGLESATDAIREGYLKKGMTREAFERAAKRLADAGAGLLVYVMLKPMPMSDGEALDDAERSAEYVRRVASRCGVRARIALNPTFVVPGTGLASDYLAGRYTPPSLAMVWEAVRRMAGYGELRVGLWDEELAPLAVPDGCGGSRGSLVRALREFNRTQQIGQIGAF